MPLLAPFYEIAGKVILNLGIEKLGYWSARRTGASLRRVVRVGWPIAAQSTLFEIIDCAAGASATCSVRAWQWPHQWGWTKARYRV